MLFVVLTGAAIAVSPLSLAMVLPLPAVCVASFGLGVFVEMMMVQWTVAWTRNAFHRVRLVLLVGGAAVWAFWLDPEKSVVERSEGVPIAGAGYRRLTPCPRGSRTRRSPILFRRLCAIAVRGGVRRCARCAEQARIA